LRNKLEKKLVSSWEGKNQKESLAVAPFLTKGNIYLKQERSVHTVIIRKKPFRGRKELLSEGEALGVTSTPKGEEGYR